MEYFTRGKNQDIHAKPTWESDDHDLQDDNEGDMHLSDSDW